MSKTLSSLHNMFLPKFDLVECRICEQIIKNGEPYFSVYPDGDEEWKRALRNILPEEYEHVECRAKQDANNAIDSVLKSRKQK